MEYMQTQCKTAIYKVYFKPVLAFSAKTWGFMKRNKRKMLAMDMKYLRSTERARKEIFRGLKFKIC
jgi:hypothetical protein